jgi:hypothetical protein
MTPTPGPTAEEETLMMQGFRAGSPMTPTEKLAGCPFCKSANVWLAECEDQTAGCSTFWVECECGSRGSISEYKEGAVQYWNKAAALCAIPVRALPSEGEITSAAKYIAETVKKTSWDGLRKDGRAADRGLDPWYRGLIGNARQEDYRDVARAVFALLSPQSDRAVTGPTFRWPEHVTSATAKLWADKIERTARVVSVSNASPGIHDCVPNSKVAVIKCFHDFEAMRLVQLLRAVATLLSPQDGTVAGADQPTDRYALEQIALLDEADGHQLTAAHAHKAVAIATRALGKHPSEILAAIER